MVTVADIAQRIRMARIEKGMTIEQLAEKADVSTGTIATFERNTNANIGLDKLVRISNVFNIKADELLELNKMDDQQKQLVISMIEKLPVEKRDKTIKLVAEIIDLVN